MSPSLFNPRSLTLISPRLFSPHSLFLRNNFSSSSSDSDLTDLSESSSSSSSSDPLLRNLEDAIQRILVRRSAPDWLPFVPGASYWVPLPPSSRLRPFSNLLHTFANPLSPEQSLSATTVRGWPSSAFFIQSQGAHLPSFDPEVDTTPSECDAFQHSDQEEG